MDKAAKPSIGIYDERTLQRQMLHNNLERMHYEVLYSSSGFHEFIQNFLIYPVDIVLYNAEYGVGRAGEMLKEISGKKKVTLLFYYGNAYANEAENLKGSYNTELFFCRGTWEDIVISLDKMMPSVQKAPNAASPVTLSPDNPFYNIASNKICVRILELLREGKNIKQIAAVTSIPEPTINYHLKKMRQETGCLSVVELVMDAKETGVL